jgi:ParB family chromosome partitioning protein
MVHFTMPKKPKKAALTAKGKKARTPRRKKTQVASKGLSVAQVSAATDDARALAERIVADGGAVLGMYADPLGGFGVVLAALPLELVEPTPYQRDRSEAHVKKLATAMERVERFLDPVIAVPKGGKYLTPNGNHRLGAMQLIGARTVTALVLPEEEVAYQILALNTEKAHNLKERSLEVIRMYRDLATISPDEPEDDYAQIFDEPHFATIGAAYEQRPRYAGGAYASIVKRLESFLSQPLKKGLAVREARAKRLLAFDDAVTSAVEALKSRGLTSPYLKNFIVARVNFLRFKKEGDFDFDETIDKLTASVKKIDTSKVSKDDVARAGGGGDAGEE